MKYVALLALMATAALAQSVDLTGRWKVSPTDDPRWAEPGIDDSSWPTLTLPQRIRGRFGIYWLRRTVPALPPSADLALAVGLMSESYDAYVNGVKVGGTGDVGAANPGFFQPRWFRVPAGLVREGAPVVVAFRTSRARVAWGALTNGIEDEGPYLITSAVHAAAEVRAANKSMRLTITPGLLVSFGQLGIGLFLLVLWFAERERREHLFFTGFLILGSLAFMLAIWTVYSGGSYAWHRYLYKPVAVLLLFSLLAFTTVVLRVRSLPVLILMGAVVLCLAGVADETRFHYLYPVIALTTWQCLRVLRSSTQETRIFAIAILVYLAALFNNSLPAEWRYVPRNLELGGMSLAFTNFLQLLFATAMMILLLRRLAADRQEKQRLAAELEAARPVQQLLLAQSTVAGGAYQVETVYEPAQEVGGDFYYVLNSEVVVVGDVSGKGLRAAMLVALLTGVLRETKERDPAGVLAALNRAVAGQIDGGFVTCCCMRFEQDGAVTAANAGHLSPYVDGREMTLEAGLPLGLDPGATYVETTMVLGPGASLTLLSDGVVEAANAKGELFGFDRTREISENSPAEIAGAAKAWGQNDDITVVTVRRQEVANAH